MNILIFGGGCAGMWLLDDLRAMGHSCVLLEKNSLGFGQTICAQGIIHGGFKYVLSSYGSTSSAVREMPKTWLNSDKNIPWHSKKCNIWCGKKILSKLAIKGATAVLSTKPRPAETIGHFFDECPGEVLELDEPVVDIPKFLQVLRDKHRDCIFAYKSVEFKSDANGNIQQVLVSQENTHSINPDVVLFCAGSGNAALRKAAGLDPDTMQLRPLHMAMAKGPLPQIYGHCIDGMKPKLTITTHPIVGSSPNVVWQLGGSIAETGVDLSAKDQIEQAKKLVFQCIPPGGRKMLKNMKIEWATYRVDRAESAEGKKCLPNSSHVSKDGSYITVWPTKLALAPTLTKEVLRLMPLESQGYGDMSLESSMSVSVARPPWKRDIQWYE